MFYNQNVLAGRSAFILSPRGLPVHPWKSSISTKCYVPSTFRCLQKASALSSISSASRLRRTSSSVMMVATAANSPVRHRNDAFVHFLYWCLIVGTIANDSKLPRQGGQGSSNTFGSHYRGGFGDDNTGNSGIRCLFFAAMRDDEPAIRFKQSVKDSIVAMCMVYIGILSGLGLRNRTAAMAAMFSQWAESFVANLQFPCHSLVAWSFHLVYSMFLLTP